MTLERPTATPLRIMRSITAKHIAALTGKLNHWSGLSTMKLLNSWGRVSREPTRTNHVFHRLLLLKIHGEQGATNLLERLYVATRLQFPLHPFEFEQPTCTEGHDMESDGEAPAQEEIYSTLDYYETCGIPGILAIVRYTADFDEIGGLDVTERSYADTPEGFCALEEDVPEALSIGVDVAVLSHIDPEYLPEINQFLPDSAKGV